MVKRAAVFHWCSAVLLLCSAVTQAADLSISPPSVQNDSNNVPITFTITNLSAGQSVTIEKYADLNDNGVVDTDEPLVHSFTVTDGQLPLIDGVRNLNVPGDDDGLENGQISVHTIYPSVGTVVNRVAGHYLYKIAGDSVTVPFEVTQDTGLQQGVTGVISAADSGQPLPNILVLLTGLNGVGGFGTFTDSSGQYTIYATPGSWIINGLAKGYVSNQVAGQVMLTNQFVTLNLALSPGSFAISGTVKDASTSAGIPGVTVTASSSTSLVAAGFTDLSGAYSLMVSPGAWSVKPDQDALPELGYVGAKKATVTVNNAPVVQDFSVPQATALFWGTVTDGQQNPVTVQVDATDSGNKYKAEGRSFGAGGMYTVGVVADSWNLGPNGSDAASLGFLGQTVSLSISDGQAARRDFTLMSSGATPTPTLASGPLPTATPIPCAGDCNGNSRVTVEEILTLVEIALGRTPIADCQAGDVDHDGMITVDEILTAVHNALTGCPGGG